MATRPILEYPDPRLRIPAEPVIEFDDSVDRLVDDLFDTLYATSGIALSAPQIGDPRQVLVADLSGDASAPEVYINPEIVASAMPGIVEESCLSVPGVQVKVVRATRIKVVASGRFGEGMERDLEGMSAVCIQHEMDHFEGKLLIDRMSMLRRWWVQAALRKRGKVEQDTEDRHAA